MFDARVCVMFGCSIRLPHWRWCRFLPAHKFRGMCASHLCHCLEGFDVGISWNPRLVCGKLTHRLLAASLAASLAAAYCCITGALQPAYDSSQATLAKEASPSLMKL